MSKKVWGLVILLAKVAKRSELKGSVYVHILRILVTL